MVARKWDKENFVQGIYNYCDRWCERCPMTSRCFLYYQDSIRRAQHETGNEDPINVNIVLEDFQQGLRETVNSIPLQPSKNRTAPEELDPVAKAPPERKQLTHPLHGKAHRFANATHKFLETLSNEIHSEKRKGVDPEGLAGIQDCFEILSWYHMQIAVKIDRALTSREEDASLHDSNGSARVAHLGLVKIMDAMMKIHEWNSSWNSDLMPLLNDLYELIDHVDVEFPGHKTFKRPGLDD